MTDLYRSEVSGAVEIVDCGRIVAVVTVVC
jgi:hypothetical protein